MALQFLTAAGRAAQALAKLARNPELRKRVAQSAQKAGEAFKNISRKAVQKCQIWQRNRAIRKAYNARKRVLEQEIKQMRAEGKSSKEIAKRASEFRKTERLRAREEMRKNGDNDLVKKLEERDFKKYKNKDGPNFEQMVEKTKADLSKELGRNPSEKEIYDAIAESATRTDFSTNLKFLTF